MRSKWLIGVFCWCVATSACLHQFARPQTAPLDEDELYWIGSAYYFHLAQKAQGWSHPHWQLLPARENPPVAKYLLGLGLWLQGHAIRNPDLLGAFYLHFEGTPGAWGDAEQQVKRAAVVASMTPEVRTALRNGTPLTLDPALLLAARRVALVCAAIASLLLFVLGGTVGRPVAGLLASQLLLLHPAVVDAYNHALADALTMPWQIAAVLAGLMLIRRQWTPGRTSLGDVPVVMVSGVLLAFACGSKMNSLVVALWIAAAALVSIGATWRGSGGKARGIAIRVLSSFAVAGLTFVALNPALWPNVAAGLFATVEEHRISEAIQAGFLGGHLVSMPDKIGAVARLTFGSTWIFALTTTLAIVALRMRCNGLWFVPGWYLIALLCIAAWIPFARDRYIIPLILPLALLVALAISTAAAAAVARWRVRGANGVARREPEPPA